MIVDSFLKIKASKAPARPLIVKSKGNSLFSARILKYRVAPLGSSINSLSPSLRTTKIYFQKLNETA